MESLISSGAAVSAPRSALTPEVNDRLTAMTAYALQFCIKLLRFEGAQVKLFLANQCKDG